MKEITEYQDGLLWMVEEGDAMLIGITQSALDACGAVGEVESADAGDEYEAGDWIGEIRGKNSTIDIVAPFDLKVVEVNEQVVDQPSQLEDDPTGDAWILRVERATADE
ncbi:MAG: glycine cleavage system protein H [Proteobacteria bacterium]|nr:MAG: glycine cleavage system protein H [Pseudomonadota bacterium]